MATCNNYQLRLNDFGVSCGEDPVTYQTYKTLDGRRKKLIARIGDGRIIKRFDKTGTVASGEDIVCPHISWS